MEDGFSCLETQDLPAERHMKSGKYQQDFAICERCLRARP